jgi:UDP-N-acetylmuramate dehydrogenase
MNIKYKNLTIKKNHPISKETSFEVGNGVLYFTEVSSIDGLKSAIKFSKENKIGIIYLGAGTNIYFPDDIIKIFVIKNSIKGIRLLKNSEIEVYSGNELYEVVDFFINRSLSGAEKLSGIPGTIGGAVYGNAGAFGSEIKDIIKEVYSIDYKGDIIKRGRGEIKFGYRWSEYKTNGEFIYKIVLKGEKGDKKEIRKQVEEIVKYREERLPSNPPVVKSAGSFFKNIVLPDGSKLAIGKLLDELGVKGLIEGGAKVSEKHANFIINFNNAKASDIDKLSEKLKKMVKDKYSIEVEREVISVRDLLK